MASPEQDLRVRITARDLTGQAFAAFKTSLQSIDSRIGALSSSFGTLMRGGAIGTAAAGLKEAADYVVGKIAEVADLADRSQEFGVSTDFHQSIVAMGAAAGASNEKVDAGLMRLTASSAKLTGETETLEQAIRRLAPASADQFRWAETGEDRLKALARAFAEVDNAGDRGLLGRLAFGKGGTRLASALADAGGDIDAVIAKLKEGGEILDQDVIKAAEELDKKFEAVVRTIDTKVKGAIVGIASAISNISTDAVASTSSQQVILAIEKMGRRSGATQGEIDAAKNRFISGMIGGPPSVPAVTQQDFGLPTAPLPRAKPALSFADTDAILEAKRKLAEDAAKSSSSAAEKEADAIEGVKKSLQSEYDQLGMTADQKELYNALTKAGVTASSDEGKAIAATVQQLQQRRDAISATTKKLEEQKKLTAEVSGVFTSATASGIVEGEKFLDVLKDITKQLAEMALQAALKPLFNSAVGGVIGGFGGLTSSGLTAADAQAIASASGGRNGGANITFAPIDRTSSGVSMRQGQETQTAGGRRIELVFEDAVARTFRAGGAPMQALGTQGLIARG